LQFEPDYFFPAKSQATLFIQKIPGPPERFCPLAFLQQYFWHQLIRARHNATVLIMYWSKKHKN